MFHVKHPFSRTPRPRLADHRHPFYDEAVADLFVEIGTLASVAVRVTDIERRAQAVRQLGVCVRRSTLHANVPLLNAIWHYFVTVCAYTEGRADLALVDRTEREFFAACREALGIND